LIFALGVAVTGFGVSYAPAAGGSGGTRPNLFSIVIAGVLTAIGGGIVGAIISIVIATASDRDTVDVIEEILKSSLESRFLSEDRRLQPAGGFGITTSSPLSRGPRLGTTRFSTFGRARLWARS
jgi:hypothetical protein